MIELNYRWGWSDGRRKVKLPKEGVRDIILNCKDGQEDKFAEKYDISASYVRNIKAGKKRRQEYQEIKKEIEEGR
jgi:hypothetical protein